MGVFSSISKLKALILVFQSPGHSQASVPKQMVENRHHPHSPAASEGLSPHTAWLCLGGSYLGSWELVQGVQQWCLCRCSAPTSGPCSACSHQRRAGWARQTPPLEGTHCRGSRGFYSPCVAFRALEVWDVGTGGLPTQGAAPTLPEVERKFQIQIMVLGVRPVAIPGTGVRCARAPGWRLLTETWAAVRSPSCARRVVGSDLNHLNPLIQPC